MLGLAESVKVVDFGLVTKEDEEEDDEPPLKRTKSAGTHSYMSPEQVSEFTNFSIVPWHFPPFTWQTFSCYIENTAYLWEKSGYFSCGPYLL